MRIFKAMIAAIVIMLNLAILSRNHVKTLIQLKGEAESFTSKRLRIKARS